MKRLLLAILMAGATPVAAIAGCAAGQVDIRLTDGGMARFSVELADDPASRERGLMFRTEMAKSAGMLFLYEQPQPATFWMRNTLIPLDMIFADATGVVQHVHANAIPKDETGIHGGTDILAVLEINGGLAKQLGISPGAVIRHPNLEQSTAAWPCSSQ